MFSEIFPIIVPYAVAWSLGGVINIKFWRLKWRTLQN